MIEIKDNKFTQEDYDLLKKCFPHLPCEDCYLDSCESCETIIKYNSTINMCEDNGVLEIALKIDRYRKTLERVANLLDRMDEIYKELPLEIIENVMTDLSDEDL